MKVGLELQKGGKEGKDEGRGGGQAQEKGMEWGGVE